MSNNHLICISDLPWRKDNMPTHSLHSLCSRICSFPPNLVKHFILNYSQERDIVFDPFSGKGTLPLEALLNGRIGFGNDISPEAYILTKAKTNPIHLRELINNLNKLGQQVSSLKLNNDVDPRVKTFYHDKTLHQIMKLRELLIKKNDRNSVFIKSIILGILHGSSSCSLSLRCSHSYSMSPNYVMNYAKKHNLMRPEKDVIECIKNKAINCLKDGLPKLRGKAFNCDSRMLGVESNFVDLIVTSPPYFAVQTYAYDNWLRLWFLGYNYKDVNKLLVNTHSEEKYAQFMQDSLKEMYRVLKKDSMCFIVIGDVKKKYSFNNKVLIRVINTAKFIEPLAKKVGFTVIDIIEDRIPKGKKVFNSYLNTEGITTERILCLKKDF